MKDTFDPCSEQRFHAVGELQEETGRLGDLDEGVVEEVWHSVWRITLRHHLHQEKMQILPCGLASHLHENSVFITENDYF